MNIEVEKQSQAISEAYFRGRNDGLTILRANLESLGYRLPPTELKVLGVEESNCACFVRCVYNHAGACAHNPVPICVNEIHKPSACGYFAKPSVTMTLKMKEVTND